MKRTYERLLFMAIGALISFTAYIIGCVSHTENIQAQDTGKKIIRCDQLIVNDKILVGGYPGAIVLSKNVDEKLVGLQVRYGLEESNSSSITLGTNSDRSLILLKDGLGEKELNTVNSYEFDNLHIKKSLIVGGEQKNNVSILGGEEPGIEIAYSGINYTNSIFLTTSQKGVGILLEDSNGEHLITSNKRNVKTLFVEESLIVGNRTEGFVGISGGSSPGISIYNGVFENPYSHIGIAATNNMASIGITLNSDTKKTSAILGAHRESETAVVVLKDQRGIKTITPTDMEITQENNEGK